jgi:putative transposase
VFIDEHVGHRHEDADGQGLRWGVESICEQLTAMGCRIVPATYYEHRGRAPSRQQVRDEWLKPKIAAAHAGNYGVFGARKVWLTLNRERAQSEPPIARCTVERLMAELGLAGAVRGKVKRTTISDPKVAKPHDLVNRNFRPLARTGFGLPNSPISRRGRAGATPRSSSTPTPAASRAGRSQQP